MALVFLENPFNKKDEIIHQIYGQSAMQDDGKRRIKKAGHKLCRR